MMQDKWDGRSTPWTYIFPRMFATLPQEESTGGGGNPPPLSSHLKGNFLRGQWNQGTLLLYLCFHCGVLITRGSTNQDPAGVEEGSAVTLIICEFVNMTFFLPPRGTTPLLFKHLPHLFPPGACGKVESEWHTYLTGAQKDDSGVPHVLWDGG